MPERVVPPCPVFGTCGGCQYQDLPYEEELRLKEQGLRQLLERAVSLPADVFRPVLPSPSVYNYRNRIDLKLLRRRDGIHIGFSPAGRGPVLEITQCPIAMRQISDAIDAIRHEAVLKLPPKYRMANLTVRCGDGPEVRWGGIGRRSTKLSPEQYLSTQLGHLKVFYSLDTFFQANLSILPAVMTLLRELPLWSRDVVFLDLYGGVGLFGLMVSDRVGAVINIEENTHSVNLARWNMIQNKIPNMEIVEGRVEDALASVYEKTVGSTKVAMIDPPRAGLSPESAQYLSGLSEIRHFLYLSCNPESLANDLKIFFGNGWKAEFVQPLDFFPRTRHLETLVLLSR